MGPNQLSVWYEGCNGFGWMGQLTPLVAIFVEPSCQFIFPFLLPPTASFYATLPQVASIAPPCPYLPSRRPAICRPTSPSRSLPATATTSPNQSSIAMAATSPIFFPSPLEPPRPGGHGIPHCAVDQLPAMAAMAPPWTTLMTCTSHLSPLLARSSTASSAPS